MKKMHRFFVTDTLPDRGRYEVEDQEVIHHAAAVVRLEAGEPVALFNGHKEACGTVEVCAKRELVIHIDSVKDAERLKTVTLYQSIVKGDHMDLIVEKTTEVGVSRIVPVISDRTIKTGLKYDRMRRIAIEASEQSGRITVPEVSDIVSLKDALQDAHERGYRMFVCDFSKQALSMQGDDAPTAVFVGPEGGWSDEERALFVSAGCQSVSLGQTVLRAETAAIVSVYLLVQ